MAGFRENPGPMGDYYNEEYQKGFKKLNDLYDKDKTLKELANEHNLIDCKILQRKREIAEDIGLIVDSIDELVCKEHPKSKFKPIKKFKGLKVQFSKDKKEKDLHVYGCAHEECIDFHLGKHSFGNIAYDCPLCGIVVGGYKIKSDYLPPGERIPLGCTTEQYHCSICDILLGYDIEKISK